MSPSEYFLADIQLSVPFDFVARTEDLNAHEIALARTSKPVTP